MLHFLSFSFLRESITESTNNYVRSLGSLIFDSPILFNKLKKKSVSHNFYNHTRSLHPVFFPIWFAILHKSMSLMLNTYSQYFLWETMVLLKFKIVLIRYGRENMHLINISYFFFSILLISILLKLGKGNTGLKFILSTFC